MPNMVKRPLALFAAGFTAALALICFLIPQHTLYTALFCAVCIILCVKLPKTIQKHVLIIFTGALAASILWIAYGEFVYSPIIDNYSGRSGVMTGVIYTNPEQKDGYCDALVKLSEIDGEKVNFRVKLYLEDCTDAKPGDIVTFYGELHTPGEKWYFSNLRYLKTRRVYLSCYTDAYSIGENSDAWWLVPIKTANILTQQIKKLMPEKNSALMAALILGNDTDLERGFTTDLQITGLSHLTAVSGMNVAFLSAIILSVFGRKRGYIIAIPAVCFFMLMAGMTASVVRAGIMQIIAMLAYKSEREYDSITAMSAAALVMFVINPYSMADAGLWMSYLASLGLILMGNPLLERISKSVKIKNFIAAKITYILLGTALTTLSAQLFVLPVQILLFGKISLISPLANVLCVWAAEAAFFAGFFASGISLVWLAGGKLFAVAATVLTNYLYAVIGQLARLPYAEADAGNVYIITAAVLIYAILILSFLIFRKNHTFSAVCAAIVLILAAAAVNYREANTLKICIIDCVTGQSVIIHDKESCTVINCGGSNSYSSNTVMRYITDNRLESIDSFILTDTRNASSGNAETLLDYIVPDRLIIPSDNERANEIIEAFSSQGTEIFIPEQSGSINCGTYDIKYYVNQDSGSMALYITAGDESILVTGSMNYSLLDCAAKEMEISGKIYIAGGDYYASHPLPESILKYCRECIISCYGEPETDAAAWNTYSGVKLTKTAEHGTVTLTVPSK